MSKDAAIEYCKANKIDKFFETSAKTGTNVEDTFALAAKELYQIKKASDESKAENVDEKNLASIANSKKGNAKKETKLSSKQSSTEKKGGCC